MNSLLPNMQIARYRFDFRVTQAIATQLYAGSALRGAFGHALKQLACVTKARECTACPLLSTCPYTQIFSPHETPRLQSEFSTIQQIPVPYLIEPPAPGARTYGPETIFSFTFVLMGAALKQLPLVIMAWRRAFLRGLGKTDGKGELVRVVLITEENSLEVFSDTSPVLAAHETVLTVPEGVSTQDIHLNFSTPLRIQKDGKILGARDIDATILLRNIIRRVSLISRFQLDTELNFDVHACNALADKVTDERRLSWQDWSRYSTRQQQKMALGGLQGHWLLRDVPPELLPFVYLGQWLHVGKETSFGMGRYQIMYDQWKPYDQENPA